MRLAYRLEGGEDTENKTVALNIRFNYKDDKDLKISVRIHSEQDGTGRALKNC